MMNPKLSLPAILAAVILSGCASQGQNYPVVGPSYPAPVQTYPAAGPAYGSSYGTVESIQLVQGGGSNGIGTGAVVGGVVGGLLGNQVGGGSGKKAATVAGVIGGAMVGHQIERGSQARNAYQLGIRMDNGSYRTVTQESAADLQVGARVRVENDRAYRY
ncbi:glycine zipper 2TM domain-containing protein [Noviherbaspirillum sp. ST9]|uniref:glycine zipper 2TM domain-containing protein n=1 Tax=Noviherbaspirillum sp. ST9 TaxID=3401606 RepID=UPI003B58AF25